MNPQFLYQEHKITDSPDDLFLKCRKGDQKAQLQVYKLYYKPVFNTCMQIVNDPATAEDIMHESFILAFDNMNSYIGDISFPSWVKQFIKLAWSHQSKANKPLTLLKSRLKGTNVKWYSIKERSILTADTRHSPKNNFKRHGSRVILISSFTL